MSAGCWPSSACGTGFRRWCSPMRPAWSRRAAGAEAKGRARRAPGRPRVGPGSGPAGGGAAQRPAQRGDDADGHQPPRVHPRDVDEQGGGGQGQRNGCRPPPVVTNDEVVPERAERAQPAAHRATSFTSAGASARARRSSAVYPSATSTTTGTSTSRAASFPGQDAPAPSAPQKIPNEVSMTPTANFRLFSGTRDSGVCTTTPTTATTTTAAAALRAARPTLFWLAPKVMAMKTTSSPSSSTPLNDSVKAYQSWTQPRRPPDAALAAATWRA